MRKLIFTMLLLLCAGCSKEPRRVAAEAMPEIPQKVAPWEDLGWDNLAGVEVNTSRLETPSGWIYRMRQSWGDAVFVVVYDEVPTGVVQ